MARIITTNPPVGKPKVISGVCSTSWVTILDVDDYEVQRTVAGAVSTVIVPGVAEIVSPIMVCNKSASLFWVSVQVIRADGPTVQIVHQQDVAAEDTFLVPLNGQFFFTGDVVQIRSSGGGVLDYTWSWTQGEAETDGT